MSGHDIDYGDIAGVVAGDPEGDGDIVGRSAKDNGKEAVKTKEKLCAAIVECWRR